MDKEINYFQITLLRANDNHQQFTSPNSMMLLVNCVLFFALDNQQRKNETLDVFQELFPFIPKLYVQRKNSSRDEII